MNCALCALAPLQRWRDSLVLTHGCSAACRVCVKDSASVLVGTLQAYALRNFEYAIENEYAYAIYMHTDMQILYIMIYHHQHICKVPQVYSSLTLYVQCPPAIHLIAPTNFVLVFCGVLHDTTPNT